MLDVGVMLRLTITWHTKNMKKSIFKFFTSVPDPHKWQSTLKSFIFGVNTSFSSICIQHGSVTYDLCELAEVF